MLPVVILYEIAGRRMDCTQAFGDISGFGEVPVSFHHCSNGSHINSGRFVPEVSGVILERLEKVWHA